MTTENGLAKLQDIRHNIEAIRRRLAYLETELAHLELEGREVTRSWAASEAKALRWALPVLEAEWDSCRRLRYRVEVTENRRFSTPVDPVTATR